MEKICGDEPAFVHDSSAVPPRPIHEKLVLETGQLRHRPRLHDHDLPRNVLAGNCFDFALDTGVNVTDFGCDLTPVVAGAGVAAVDDDVADTKQSQPTQNCQLGVSKW